MAKSIGNSTVHRVVNDNGKKFVLHVKNDYQETVYLDTVPVGSVSIFRLRQILRFLFKHLGLIMGATGIAMAIAAFTVFGNSMALGALSLFSGLIFAMVGFFGELLARTGFLKKTLAESFFKFVDVSYFPDSNEVPGSYSVTTDQTVKYLNAFSDKEFAVVVKNIAKWNSIEAAHNKLRDEIHQSNSTVDEEFLVFAKAKEKELEEKMVEVEAERYNFVRAIKKSASEGRLLSAMEKAEEALVA